MHQIDSIKIHAWERLLERELEEFINDFELLRANLRSVIVLSGTQDIAQSFKVDQFLSLERVQFSIELEDFFLRSIDLYLVIVEVCRARDLATPFLLGCTTKEIVHQVLVTLFFGLWIWVNLTCSIWEGVLSKELGDLVDIRPAKIFSRTEHICDFKVVCSVVDWQLTENSVSKIDIDDFVVLSSWENLVTWVLDCGSHTCCSALTSLLGSLSRVLDLANLVPFVFSVTPHIGERCSIFFKDLDKAVRLATNLAFNRRFEVRQVAHIKLLATLSRRFTFFLVLRKVGTLFLSSGIAGERPNFLVFAAHDDVAPLVVCDRPDRLWQLNRLLALAISPEFDCAVVASCDDLACLQAIN